MCFWLLQGLQHKKMELHFRLLTTPHQPNGIGLATQVICRFGNQQDGPGQEGGIGDSSQYTFENWS